MATVKLETFAPGTPVVQLTNFAAKLQNAVNNAAPGTVIDCTSYTGRVNFRTPINITRSVTLVFGNITLGYTGGNNTNMFNVYAPNVKIQGVRRAGTSTADTSVTRLFMTTQGAGYHIFVGATAEMAEQQDWVSRHGFELHDIELKGIASIIEVDDDDQSTLYNRTGAGGLQIIKGSPFSNSEFIDDVLLSNVLVDGTRNHGILMLGARSSVIKNCTVLNAGGHGFMMDGGKSNVIESCRAELCKLAGFHIRQEQFTTLEGCLTRESGLGYFLRSTKSVTLSSCGAENNIDRGRQPFNYGVTVHVPLTFTLDDVGQLHVFAFDGSSYLVFGQQNYDACSGVAQELRYGYTCLDNNIVRQLQVSNSTIDVNCETGGDCPAGFKCVNGKCAPDETSNEWLKVGSKPSGGNIYRGPGYQQHDPNGINGRIEFHTGWDDGEELRVYGVTDAAEYGWVEYEGKRVRQIITSEFISGVTCTEGCPPGFMCDDITQTCRPDDAAVDENNVPLWTLLGNKPNLDTPVLRGPLNIQYHTGWNEGEELVQRMYYQNNNIATDFTNEGTVLNACYSKDPGNRGDSIFYTNGQTTHFKFRDAFYNVEIVNPLMKQPFGTKYKMMFLFDNGQNWDRYPSYSTEGGNMQSYRYADVADLDYLQVADVLDQID